MGRVLAIDYGTKRVGVAITDKLQIIASGLTTVHSTEILSFVEAYCAREEVETIVVGEPKKLNNQVAEVEQHIRGFIRNLKKKLPNIRIDRYDERFSSKIAYQSIVSSGIKKMKRRNKELIDEVSATIILQSYLESRK